MKNLMLGMASMAMNTSNLHSTEDVLVRKTWKALNSSSDINRKDGIDDDMLDAKVPNSDDSGIESSAASDSVSDTRSSTAASLSSDS